ncbi:hypothetical protein DPMN_033308 [Dreissena polymorpha]|uniref:Uncharacterized protein n=1 Tax=Dreissena polymorpha TaxID=45954 RepID=A0A9D4M5T4_DREPO|nr:hypothetical protein DPMN_033308 [Dreissena polymorpha]
MNTTVPVLSAAAQMTVTDPMNVTVTTTGTGTITKVTVVMETVAMETKDMAVEIGRLYMKGYIVLCL